MNDEIPLWISMVFGATMVFTVLMFYLANGRRKFWLYVLIAWAVLQSSLALSGFYWNTDTIPPRLVFILVPPVTVILLLLVTSKRRAVIEQRNLIFSTFLHGIRVPVEIVLYALCLEKVVPKLITFEGLNFDILTGGTAIVVGSLIVFFGAAKLRTLLIVWNLIGLVLVLNVVTLAILSAETPFQQYSISQPNRAPLYFPFVLLPALVVPLVIFSHLSDLILLFQRPKRIFSVVEGGEAP